MKRPENKIAMITGAAPGYRRGVREGNMEKVHLFDGQTEAVIR
jgi:hypothetical protein